MNHTTLQRTALFSLACSFTALHAQTMTLLHDARHIDGAGTDRASSMHR